MSFFEYMEPNFQGVEISGDKHLPVIVFLHSSLSSRKQWYSLTSQLRSQFLCINIDILGYGGAPLAQKNSTFQQEIDRIIDVLAALKITSNVTLVGHSCGGAIGLALLARNPKLISRLALFEPVSFHLLANKHDEQLSFIADFSARLSQLPSIEGAQEFINYWNGEGYFQRLPNAIQQDMALKFEKVLIDFNGILSETYTLDCLSECSQPCLIMVGKDSQPVSHLLSSIITTSMPNANLLSVEGGHMAPIANTKAVNESLIEFLLRE